MPRPPLIESERTRNMVVAIVMAILLVAALGVAAMVTYARQPMSFADQAAALNQTNIGHLDIGVPTEWSRVITPDPSSGSAVDDLAQFTATDGTQRRLIVASLREREPAAVTTVLERVAAGQYPEVMPRAARILGQPKRLSGNLAAGWMMFGLCHETREWFMLIAFTEDARQYGVICVLRPYEAGDNQLRWVYDDRLIAGAMYVSAGDRTLTDASADHLAGTGLAGPDGAFEPPAPLVARAGDLRRERAWVYLHPSNRPDASALSRSLAVMRLRTTVNVKNAGLGEPAELFTREFRQHMNRPPRSNEIDTGTLGDQPVVRMTMPISAPGGSRLRLWRETWYMPLNDHRAALLEILAEPGVMRQMRAFVQDIHGALVEQNIGEDASFDAAQWRADGRRFAEAFASEAAALKPRQWFGQVIADGQVWGGYAIEVEPDEARGPGATRGQIVRKMQLPDDHRLILRWAADPAAGTYDRVDKRSLMNPRRQRYAAHRLTLRAGRLRYAEVDFNRPSRVESVLWETEAEANHLWPLADDHWPTEALDAMLGRTFTLQMTESLLRPTTMLVSVQRLDSAPDVAEAAYLLTFRDPIALTASVLLLDADGQLVRGTWYQPHPTGGQPISARRISEQELREAMPGLLEILEPDAPTSNPDARSAE